MWICPKCNREFKNTNQSHYCGEKPKTIDEYIDRAEESHKERLIKMREIINGVSEDIQETILWSMPYFILGKNQIAFASGKNHISFFIGKDATEKFAHKFDNNAIKYNCNGTVQLAWNKELPVELITEIARICFNGVLENGN